MKAWLLISNWFHVYQLTFGLTCVINQSGRHGSRIAIADVDSQIAPETIRILLSDNRCIQLVWGSIFCWYRKVNV